MELHTQPTNVNSGPEACDLSKLCTVFLHLCDYHGSSQKAANKAKSAGMWHLQESALRLGIGSDLVLSLFGLGWLLLAGRRLHLVGLSLLSVRLQQGAHRPALVTHGHSQRSVASHHIGIKAGTQQQGAQDCAHVKAVTALQKVKLTWWPWHQLSAWGLAMLHALGCSGIATGVPAGEGNV